MSPERVVLVGLDEDAVARFEHVAGLLPRDGDQSARRFELDIGLGREVESPCRQTVPS